MDYAGASQCEPYFALDHDPTQEWISFDGDFSFLDDETFLALYNNDLSLPFVPNDVLETAPEPLPVSGSWSVAASTSANTTATPSVVSSPRERGEGASYAEQRKRKRESVDLASEKRIVPSYGSDPSAGTMMVFGPMTPRRTRYDPETRVEVAKTRKQGACHRCRTHKTQCRRTEHSYQMCRSCRSVPNPLSLKMPCFLETFIDARLFRHKPSDGHPLYFGRQGVYELEDAVESTKDVLQVRLVQGLGEELSVNIALYEPQPGDKSAHTYADAHGKKITVELPPYRLVDLDVAKERMLDYVERSRDAYIHNLINADQLTFQVLNEARRFATLNPTSTARKALNLLAADRIIEREWTICDGDGTGIPLISSMHGTADARHPVTPMMDGQLDQLVIQGFLQPLRKELLEQLQQNINTARHENWFDIFLTTFVLLSNAEQLLAHSRRNAIRHGAQGRYNSPELASLYFHACKMFIAHFHFVSNFKMLLAIDLFSSEIHKLARLDQNQITFLQRLQDSVRTNKSGLLQLRSDFAFETPSYWTHQIMFQDWSPCDPKVEERHILNAPMAC